MKNTILIICFIGFLALIAIEIKSCSQDKPTVIHTDRVKNFIDTIDRIKTIYLNKYVTISNSTRPDTFIRNFTDTVFGNHDSFIYVTILKGQECCEIVPFKDSIIKEDSIHIVNSENYLKRSESKLKQQKVFTRIYTGIVLGLVGALIVK